MDGQDLRREGGIIKEGNNISLHTNPMPSTRPKTLKKFLVIVGVGS